MLNTNEIKLRQGKIAVMLEECGIDGILISSTANILYLLGEIAGDYVFIHASGEYTVFARVPRHYAVPFRRADDISAYIKEKYADVKSISFDDEYLSASDYFRLETAFENYNIKKRLNIMRRVRMIKTPLEIAEIKESAEMLCSVYKKIPSLFKEGMTDIELSAEIERKARLAGHLGIFRTFGNRMDIFMGSVLAGDNAAVPSPFDFALGGAGSHPSLPVGACGKKILPGQTVMVDISGNKSGYLCDMTRVFSYGEIPEKARKMHHISIEIHEILENLLTEGKTCREVVEKAVEKVEKYSIFNAFMGVEKQAKFIGHGVGLEINELPVLTAKDETVLKEGMVIAAEPKFVVEGVGAVGVEDTYIITKGAPVRITSLSRGILQLK